MVKGHMQDGKFHPHTDYKKGTRKSRDQSAKTQGVRVRMRRYNVCEPFLEDPASHKPDDTKHTNQVMYSLGDESCASVLTDEEFSMLLTIDQVANTFSPIGETATKWQQDDAFRKRIIDRAQELNEQKKVDRKARDWILPESKEIWEGNSPSARLKLLGREKGNAKIAKLKWEDVPKNKKVKFSTGIEDWSAKIR